MGRNAEPARRFGARGIRNVVNRLRVDRWRMVGAVTSGEWAVALVLLAVLPGLPSVAPAQPDPRQMSGIPLPDPQLPAGTITVRVVRGTLSNNVPDQTVELREGDNVATAVTNAEGRAEFLTLNPGATVVASTELDGVRLQSQPFPVPGQGGIRLMLVGAADPTRADEPAESGTVTFGADSRIVIELGEETLNVYYLLDIINDRAVPVEPGAPIMLALPAGATGATMMGGSTPRAEAAGARVSVSGPFEPGLTPLRVGFVLPYAGDSVAIEQTMPVTLEALLLVVEKWGSMDVASDQIARRADMNPEGTDETYIFAAGPPVASGAALSLEVSGLPHHSRLPAMLALGVAFVFLGAGAWGAATPKREADGAELRRRLESRREKRFRDLVRNEQQHRAGRIGDTKYANRRNALMAELERIYAELDDELAPVLPSPGVAAAAAPPVASRSGSASRELAPQDATK